MSTRGWYEFYVIDDETMRTARSMQFYKWGDATPHNAVEELAELKSLLKALGNRLPVHLAQELLRENLDDAYDALPPSFPLGCMLFLLLRAAEDVAVPFRRARQSQLPKEERPEMQLDDAVRKAASEQKFAIPSHQHPAIARAYFTVAVGRFVRPWRPCSTEMTFLRWLQYITQPTKKIEMGAIAGDYVMPIDVSYIYRFFFRVRTFDAPEVSIDSFGLQVCDREEQDLRTELLAQPRDAYDQVMSLDEVLATHPLVSSPFWERRLPRNSYLGP
ncbi:MAG TPA: hypothetical protein VM925_36260 [Labilithrix sp.]|jgi:hypothetical protein|nr:hypothetical protein [Labilithrix sp.]